MVQMTTITATIICDKKRDCDKKIHWQMGDANIMVRVKIGYYTKTELTFLTDKLQIVIYPNLSKFSEQKNLNIDIFHVLLRYNKVFC